MRKEVVGGGLWRPPGGGKLQDFTLRASKRRCERDGGVGDMYLAGLADTLSVFCSSHVIRDHRVLHSYLKHLELFSVVEVRKERCAAPSCGAAVMLSHKRRHLVMRIRYLAECGTIPRQKFQA